MLATGRQSKPWWWADTIADARIVPRLHHSTIALHGSRQAPAVGPDTSSARRASRVHLGRGSIQLITFAVAVMVDRNASGVAARPG